MSKTAARELNPTDAQSTSVGQGRATLADDDAYRVVARRYRPQSFENVVGQDHVVQTLRNAIRLNRVTHAYLFCGTRGVGKTSVARIFAKCLNCVAGPTETPCNECDICQAISIGQDVDVIEIDGASNNGVEQVRELRQNASLRPSRSRYKIYYIDEVHMLSTGAFNALLKTLEEPPAHVKFFFATTEAGKIPDTIISRCQRFDFAGIGPMRIADTLSEICQKEGVEADRDGLMTIARRAGGSMRDAQSLLEQMLSFQGRRVTDQLVRDTLGLAPDERVVELVEALAGQESARALQVLEQSMGAGVQPVDLLNSLLEFLRDVMVLAAGASDDLVSCAPSVREHLKKVAGRWSIDTVLAALQILAETRGRMRGSVHGRLLVELALCRVARLENLVEVTELIRRLEPIQGVRPIPAAKKKNITEGNERPDARVASTTRPQPPRATDVRSNAPEAPGRIEPLAENGHDPDEPEPAASVPEVDYASRPLVVETFREAWPTIAATLGPALGSMLSKLEPITTPQPGMLAVSVPREYNFAADRLESTDAAQRLDSVLRELFGRPVKFRFDRVTAEQESARPRSKGTKRAARHEDLEADPLVQDIVKIFDARAMHVELDDEADL